MHYIKALELKRLYQLKTVGVRYSDNQKKVNINNYSLPNDFENLKSLVMDCHLCELSKSRKKVVFGEGNINSPIMFIGEAPGASEDESGRPFVGRAGQLLTKIIESVLLCEREDVYIANVIKCRPPQNRVPSSTEVASCKPYILKQIAMVNPKILVALGTTSYQFLTDDMTPISRVRGVTLEFGDKILIPTFHPSYLLRNPSAKKDAYRDFLKIKAYLEEI